MPRLIAVPTTVAAVGSRPRRIEEAVLAAC